jgi:hypothetical protein
MRGPDRTVCRRRQNSDGAAAIGRFGERTLHFGAAWLQVDLEASCRMPERDGEIVCELLAWTMRHTGA